MASGTILFGFAAVFCCLEHLEEATTKIQAEQSGSARLAAAAFVAAVVTTFGLTLLLLFSYIRALDAGRRFLFLGCLAKSTRLAATASLLTGPAVQLLVSGYLAVADLG
jgi:hypothetical protein